MSHGVLAVMSVVNATTAASFLAAGVHLARRNVPTPDRLALRAAATWWLAMGGLVGLQALEAVVAVGGATSLQVSMAIRYANAILLAAGGWGLCFHVTYLRTGNPAWSRRLVPYFVVVAFLYAASAFLHPLVALEISGYELTGIHEPPLDGSLLWQIVVLAVGMPLLVASVGYLLLVRRLQRRDQKRRAVLASTGILLWVGAGLVVQLVGGPRADFVTITVLGLLAAILVALAYFPPVRLRRDDEPGGFLELATSDAT